MAIGRIMQYIYRIAGDWTQRTVKKRRKMVFFKTSFQQQKHKFMIKDINNNYVWCNRYLNWSVRQFFTSARRGRWLSDLGVIGTCRSVDRDRPMFWYGQQCNGQHPYYHTASQLSYSILTITQHNSYHIASGPSQLILAIKQHSNYHIACQASQLIQPITQHHSCHIASEPSQLILAITQHPSYHIPS
jgi:hypothetical protein